MLEPQPITTKTSNKRSQKKVVFFYINRELHKILMSLACAEKFSISEALQKILDDWCSLFAGEIEAWKKKTDAGFTTVCIAPPAWIRKEKKAKLRVYLNITTARIIPIGQVMTQTKISEFLGEVIAYWASMNMEKIAPFMEKNSNFLKNRIPRLNLGRVSRRIPKDPPPLPSPR